jgi:hypothetical protein
VKIQTFSSTSLLRNERITHFDKKSPFEELGLDMKSRPFEKRVSYPIEADLKYLRMNQNLNIIKSSTFQEKKRSFHKISHRSENFPNLYPLVFSILAHMHSIKDRDGYISLKSKTGGSAQNLQFELKNILVEVQKEVDLFSKNVSKPLRNMELKIDAIKNSSKSSKLSKIQLKLKNYLSISLGTILLTGYIYIVILLAKNLHL